MIFTKIVITPQNIENKSEYFIFLKICYLSIVPYYNVNYKSLFSNQHNSYLLRRLKERVTAQEPHGATCLVRVTALAELYKCPVCKRPLLPCLTMELPQLCAGG